MADVAERRFLHTKSKLESLNYHQPLGIESAPLVEKLLNDLIRTTESFQSTKNQSGKLSNETNYLSNQLEPLRKTNQRLIRENNQLHTDIIKKDEAEAEKERKWSEKMRKIESESTEVRFMNTQQNHKLKAMEQELNREKKRVEELLQRHITNYVSPSGDTEELGTRNPAIELSHNLDTNKSVNGNTAVDPAMFDKKIEQLSEQIKVLTAEKEAFEEKERNFTKQVQIREREIMRLAKAVEAGSDPDKLHLESIIEANGKTIQQLRLQLEALHNQSQAAPKQVEQVKVLQQKVDELVYTNEQLKTQNEEAIANNKTVVAERKILQQQVEGLKMSPKVAQREDSTQLKVEITKLQQDILNQKKLEEDLRATIADLEKENIAQHKRIESLELSLSNESKRAEVNVQTEVKQLQDKIIFLQSDKQSFGEVLEKSEREKMALLGVVSGFESELADIQQSIKQLTVDRDQITESYHAVSEELEDKMTENHKLFQESAVNLARIAALELRIKELLDDNEKLASVIKASQSHSPNQHQAQHYQSLLKTMSAQTESLRGANELLEQKVVELSDQLSHHSREEDGQVKELEEMVSQQKSDIDQLINNNAEYQLQITKLKEALLHADSTLNQVEASVNRNSRHSLTYNSTIQQLQSEADVLRSEIKRKDAEISDQRHIIENLDREKDTLLHQLDEKDEEVVQLAGLKDTEVQSRERIVSSLTNANTQADKLTEMVVTKDKEIFSLNSKGLLEEKLQMEAELIHLHKELDMLTKDFTSISRDNQTLHASLEREKSEKESLNKDVREYCARVAYLEEYLKGREIDQEELLAAYQNLGDENGKLSETFKLAQEQIEALNGNMKKQANEMVSMENHIRDVEQENEHYVLDLQAFERQTDVMSKRLSELEDQFSVVNEDREMSGKELLATRDFTTQLVQSKDTILRELAQSRQMCDRQAMELQQCNSRIAALNAQLEAEAKRIVDLETLLKNESLKGVQSHMASETNSQENEQLKDSLRRLTQQHAGLQQELISVEKNKQRLEEELTKTRRTVITSNYEREAIFSSQKDAHHRNSELEKMVEDQQLVIQAMDEERVRFKNFVMKYETELNKSESRLSEILSQLFASEQKIQRLEGDVKNKDDELLLYKSVGKAKHTPSPTPSLSTTPSPTPPSLTPTSTRRPSGKNEDWSGYSSSGAPVSIPLHPAPAYSSHGSSPVYSSSRNSNYATKV